jgi:YwiC-like protein
VSRTGPRLLSLPREHGAWITLGAAVSVGLVLARHDDRLVAAAGMAVCLVVAFLARAPMEQLAIRRPARFDPVALALLLVPAVAGTTLAARGGLLFGSFGAAIAFGGGAAAALARRARVHRHQAFEALAMGGLGAAALPIASASGTPLSVALFPSVALAVHAAVAVPLLRTELRPRERVRGGAADLQAAVALAACALLFVAGGHALLAAALAPRFLHLGARRLGVLALRTPVAIGVREIVLLAAAAALAVRAP